MPAGPPITSYLLFALPVLMLLMFFRSSSKQKREQQNVRLNITSAADLRDRQQGAPQSSPVASGFKVGEKVRHHKFGEGQVLAVKASGLDEEVTVMFKTAGTKRLLASMARLERV